MHDAARPRLRADDGATAVEFAVISALLFTVLFGIFQSAVFVWRQQAVTAAAREAARYGVGTSDAGGTPQFIDCAGIVQAAKDYAKDLALLDQDITVTWVDSGGAAVTNSGGSAIGCGTAGANPSSSDLEDGDRIVVNVEYDIGIALPFVSDFWLPTTVDAEVSRSVYPEGSTA